MRIALLISLILLFGCSHKSSEVSAASAADAERTLRLWSASCALCHVDGNAGAPRLGNVQEWQGRLVQGEEVLLTHTLDGLGDMPPLGYCMACEREDSVALIRFMTDSVAEPQP